MRKYLLSFFVFAASAAYVGYQYIGGGSASASAPSVSQPSTQVSVNTPSSGTPVTTPVPTQTTPTQPVTTPTPAPTPTPTPKPTPTPTPAPTPVTAPQGQYADGTYTGSSADAYYGTVQVQATIQGGALTDVSFLQYPNDRRTSQYINSQAMPLLRQEAIQAQSANVNGVSGASDTSAAFRESLANALAQAKN